MDAQSQSSFFDNVSIYFDQAASFTEYPKGWPTTRFVRYGSQILGFQVSGPQPLSAPLTRELSVMRSLVFSRKRIDQIVAQAEEKESIEVKEVTWKT